MRKRRWVELLKGYDFNTEYHPGKANVVADALIRKSSGSLSYIHTVRISLLLNLGALNVELAQVRKEHCLPLFKSDQC